MASTPQPELTTTITSGRSLYTTLLDTASPTELLEIVVPTAITTTIISGTVDSTTTTTGPDGLATVEVAYPAGLVCNAFENPYNQYEGDYEPSDFDPSHFNSYGNSLITCGIAVNVDFDSAGDDGYGTLPGQDSQTELTTIAVVFQGYFLAPQSGNYVFEANCDDFGYIWIQSAAFTDWADENYILGGATSVSLPVFFQEGDSIPITILYANFGGDASSRFTVILPDEMSVDGSTDYFYQPHSNDLVIPPPGTDYTTPTGCEGNGFQQFYFGSGYTLNPSYISDYDDNDAVQAYFSPHNDYNVDEVVQVCERVCYNNFGDSGCGAFDLHFLTSESIWECVLYEGSGGTPDSSDYNIQADVTQAYGFIRC